MRPSETHQVFLINRVRRALLRASFGLSHRTVMDSDFFFASRTASRMSGFDSITILRYARARTHKSACSYPSQNIRITIEYVGTDTAVIRIRVVLNVFVCFNMYHAYTSVDFTIIVCIFGRFIKSPTNTTRYNCSQTIRETYPRIIIIIITIVKSPR